MVDPATRRGERLAALRQQAGLTQTELADVVGITQPSVSRIEAGKQGMSEETRAKVSDALGMDPADVWPYVTIDEVSVP